MKIFRWLGRWWRVYRLTHGLFNALNSIFQTVGGARLDEKFWKDEFVIAYMYGVMARFFDVYSTVGPLASAQILLKCYEWVFPGHGMEIIELAVGRIKDKDAVFMRHLQVGWRETSEYLADKHKGGFPSLKDHLTIRHS